jgi:hypothetical protein
MPLGGVARSTFRHAASGHFRQNPGVFTLTPARLTVEAVRHHQGEDALEIFRMSHVLTSRSSV